MKKLLIIVMVFVLLFSVSIGFAGGTKKVEKKRYTIAMIVKNVGNPFFEAAKNIRYLITIQLLQPSYFSGLKLQYEIFQ